MQQVRSCDLMGMDLDTRVQILDVAIRIRHGANTLSKGMNPTSLPQAMRK